MRRGQPAGMRSFAPLLLACCALGLAMPLSPASQVWPAAPGLPAPPRVVALGKLEPASRVLRLAGPPAMSAAIGRIAAIHVREGDAVPAGAALATLDTEPALAASRQQAEATLAMKRAALARTLAELATEEARLSAALAQQRAEADRARWDLDRLARLQRSGMYQPAALVDRRLAWQSAERRVETAAAQLARNRARDADGLRVDEAVARADLAAAEAALRKAVADHAQAVLRAPVAARVLRLMGRLGEQVGSDGFAELGDTTAMLVRAELFESDLRFVAPGSPAEVTSRALDAPLAGVVERIGLFLGQQSVVREDPAAVLDARVVEAWIRLEPDASQRVAGLTGLQVRVAIPRRGAGDAP